MVRRIGRIVLVALSVAACGGTSPSAAVPTSSLASAFPGSAAAVQAAVMGGGYACTARGDVAGFHRLECPKPGVADIDIYARADGTVAGIDAYAPGAPMTADAILAVLGPALDEASGSDGWADIAAVVRAAGSSKPPATVVLPGSGLSVLVQHYANGGLEAVIVLAPDLAAIWGHPPVPSPSAS